MPKRMDESAPTVEQEGAAAIPVYETDRPLYSFLLGNNK